MKLSFHLYASALDVNSLPLVPCSHRDCEGLCIYPGNINPTWTQLQIGKSGLEKVLSLNKPSVIRRIDVKQGSVFKTCDTITAGPNEFDELWTELADAAAVSQYHLSQTNGYTLFRTREIP